MACGRVNSAKRMIKKLILTIIINDSKCMMLDLLGQNKRRDIS